MSDKVAETKAKLREPKATEVIDWTKGLSCGLTLGNLACSGRPDVAFLPGHYYGFVGDSGSGKTWLLMQTFAEAAYNPVFKKYRLILDQPERGALMSIKKYFGDATFSRVGSPHLGRPSRLLEEFYDQVDDEIKTGDPFLYGLDSEDALPPLVDVLKSQEDKGARRTAMKKGKDPEDAKIGGTMGMGRAKLNSSQLRQAHNGLEKSGSMLFVIKQTRDRIGFGSQYDPKTKSGGNAITFYATDELWFSVRGDLKKSARGKDRVVGQKLRIKVKKNRTSGRPRPVDLLFYYDTGFDESGTNVNFLCEEGQWECKTKNRDVVSVEAPEFQFKGTTDDLIKKIEDEEGGTDKLRRLVTEVWKEIEEECRVVRKPRYGAGS